MKFETRRTEPRWEWEKTKKVAVFAMDDKLSVPKSDVIGFIEELLGEFAIPLDMIDGNLKHSRGLLLIKEILSMSMKNDKINYEQFEKELRKVRNVGGLPYGIVILIDKGKYEFYNKPGQQPAIYGIGVEDGLVILRYTHKASVRHEFAHILGLNHHHPPKQGCIMNWECATSTFCDECKGKIQEMWEDKMKAREMT